LVPPLPIPNRTVKRLSADDSAATSVKVGHRQAVTPENPRRQQAPGVFALGRRNGLAPRRPCAKAKPNISQRIKLLQGYVFVRIVDAMQVFGGIICKKLLVLSIAEE
jgi:hypothetical protein